MKGIRRLDNFIATPAYIVVLITGVLMVFGGVVSFQTGWVVASLALYVVLVVLGMAFYSPALKRQIAEAERDVTSAAYTAAARRTSMIGMLTTAVALVIVALMVTKPFETFAVSMSGRRLVGTGPKMIASVPGTRVRSPVRCRRSSVSVSSVRGRRPPAASRRQARR